MCLLSKVQGMQQARMHSGGVPGRRQSPSGLRRPPAALLASGSGAPGPLKRASGVCNAYHFSTSRGALLHLLATLLVELHLAPRVHHNGLLLLDGCLQPAVLTLNVLQLIKELIKRLPLLHGCSRCRAWSQICLCKPSSQNR